MANPKIFVNLPVKDLPRSMVFFKALGYQFDPRFTDQKAGCLMLGGDLFAMLVSESFYKTFIKDREIANARAQNETLIGLSAQTREEVDKIMERVLAAGGRDYRKEEYGDWMYSRSFEDLDGHIWELIYMDLSKAPTAKSK